MAAHCAALRRSVVFKPQALGLDVYHGMRWSESAPAPPPAVHMTKGTGSYTQTCTSTFAQTPRPFQAEVCALEGAWRWQIASGIAQRQATPAHGITRPSTLLDRSLARR